MCGILGAINFTGFFSSKDFRHFVSLTDLVQYRGPDASGYLALNLKESSVNDEKKFDIFLGHRRLSIIDLSERANQPLTDGNGVWIIYNGEVFNYVELRNELKDDGYIFKTDTDTEVILNVYKKYGETGFDRLNGMWAFAIVDIPNRKVILSRDRFSIKPLYYTRDDSQFYFASEIKQLLPFLKKKEINREVMFKHIEQGLRDYNEETFYQNIYKLKPKYNMVIRVDSGDIKESKYWDYSPEPEKLTYNEMIERFRELFIDSVRIRLRSDVKVGALLSGGLDSSSISVIADDLQNGEFCTYSVISKNKKYSEEKYIDILSKSCKIQNHKIFFEFDNPVRFLSDIEKVIYYHDEPFSGFSTVAHYKLLEALKMNSDITVVLSGQGGDEILMGYLKYFLFRIRELINRGALFTAAREVLNSFLKKTMVWQFKLDEAKRYMPFLMNKEPKTFLKIHGVLEPYWKFNSLRERQMLDIDRYSVPSLTHYEDRTSMAHSLEIRLPFLDHRLVNFVLNLPTTLKINKGWAKYILREALNELPNPIRWRKDKQGFITSEKTWLKEDFEGLIREVFAKSILDEMGIIDSRAFLQYYRRFQNGNRLIWYLDISRALIAELWARRNWA